MPTRYDAIVIGSGQAGPFLAARLAGAGMQTALVEREHLGGTCVNDGCIPTKALLASARAAFVARQAGAYGVHIDGPVSVDMAAVKARKDRIVGQSIDSLTNWLQGVANLQLVWGHARFTAPDAIEVATPSGAQRLHAPRIFINVGGRAVLPDWPGINDVPVLTNTSMMAIDRLPEHLIVVGASYVGLEFAQMYRRFGARVTVVDVAERVIAREDADVSREVQAILEREGIRFHLALQCAKVAATHGGTRIRLALNAAGAAHEVEGSHLLAAIGRRPNTDDLGLARAGIATDARGFIRVDEQLRTNVPGVWALGDVNGRGAFTHTAYNDHEIVAANLLEGGRRRVGERIPAYALFTDPPLGRVGLTETEARASGRRVRSALLPMSRVGRARERDETQGFMKIVVDGDSERILGAALLGIEGDEVVHSLLAAMAAGVSYKLIQQTVPIHPTVSELIPTLLANLSDPPVAH
jgi:pyruvate/2-oxoglutarate dehydrogenase complex dihydrolipoamide dehydrogenase (E3) component